MTAFSDAGPSGKGRSSGGRAAPLMRQPLPGGFGPRGRCVRARTLPLGLRSLFSDDGLSGTSRSSDGRAAPLMRERLTGTVSAVTNKGRHLPRMARSASPPQRQALPGGFGPRGRCVRARTLPLDPRSFFADAGLSGKGRSSGGRAAPLMRERFPGGPLQPSRQRAAPAPGGAKRQPPGRGRRFPVALGDRAGRVESARGGRVTGPCRLRRVSRGVDDSLRRAGMLRAVQTPLSGGRSSAHASGGRPQGCFPPARFPPHAARRAPCPWQRAPAAIRRCALHPAPR